MPTFNREALRKGAKAIDEALESRRSGGGDFRPFLPNIYWKNDKDFRYLLFLNPLEEIPEVDFHPYIDCDDGKPHMCFAHTDKSFDNSKDAIQERWGYKPRLTGLAVAVELEPDMEIKGGYSKPIGFEVKTTTFERKVRDEEGEPTGEVEELTAPVVGLVAQSPFNFFNVLKETDATEAAVHRTPIKITRIGKKSNVTYQITAYDTIPPEKIDLSGLLDYVENLSYVAKEDAESLIEAIDNAGENVEEATTAIGGYLLNKRIDELADTDLYDELLSKITKPAKFQDDKDEKKVTKRPSQRRSKSDASGAEPVAARARKEGESESKPSPREARMAKLRSQAKASKKNDNSE